MEEDLKKMKMEDDLNNFFKLKTTLIFDIGRQPKYFEDGRRPHFYLNGRRTKTQGNVYCSGYIFDGMLGEG